MQVWRWPANSHAPGWQFHYSPSEANASVLSAIAAQSGQIFIYVPSGPSGGPDNSQVLVGTDILQNLHMLIDYRSWQIYVSKK